MEARENIYGVGVLTLVKKEIGMLHPKKKDADAMQSPVQNPDDLSLDTSTTSTGEESTNGEYDVSSDSTEWSCVDNSEGYSPMTSRTNSDSDDSM